MSDFVFADQYQLEPGPTRDFYVDFLKGFVHKQNNLMGVIQGFSSLVLYEDSLNEETRENAQQINDSARSATEINREALTGGGTGKVEIGTIQIGDLMTYWKGKAQDICTDAGASFQSEIREGLPPVLSDSSKLSEIFVALMNNAAEEATTIPNGTVALDIFPPGEASPSGNVDIFIRNSSRDMSTETIQRFIRPFESDKTTGNVGLGLTTAAVICGDLKHKLGIRNEDGTTTAWISIPVA